MKKRLRRLAVPVLALCLACAGCMRDDSTPLASELDEPNYRQGQQLVKQGRYQESLTAFLKVIAKRNEDAPESHLEVGLIYSQYMRNHIAAIYHYNKYLELQPNSRQAALVRQRIDAAKREFARTLPAQPLENATERLEMQEQVSRLQRENDQLKAELAAVHNNSAPVMRPPGGSSSSSTRAPAEPPLISIQPGNASPVTLTPYSGPDAGNPSSALTPTVPHAGTTRQVTARPTSPPANSARRYSVQPKDTLYGIAQRHYGAAGAGAKAQAIYEANRDVMKSPTDVRPGMVLRLP